MLQLQQVLQAPSMVTRRRESERRRQRLARFRAKQRRQRAVFFTVLSFVSLLHSCYFGWEERTVWSLYHPDQWWENAYRYYDDFQFLENFRMTRVTFDYLCKTLSDELKGQTTNMRLPISVERQVGVTLWILGTNSDFRTVGALFGVAKSTVCSVLHKVCKALCAKRAMFIVFPHGEELDRVIVGYRNKWGFPNAGGAIDGSHIPIVAPHKNPADYHNRKGWYSMILQAVVNDRYEFTDINVGWPGSVHDARVYSNSGIYMKGHSGELFQQKTVTINNETVPIVLLGDPAYPLSTFLMKPFVDTGRLTAEKKHFNYLLSRNRMTVENAFGRLKGRWRCLLKRLDISVNKVPSLITSCCILHNICEQSKDSFRLEWLEEVANTELAQPNLTNQNLVEDVIDDSVRVREVITNYIDQGN